MLDTTVVFGLVKLQLKTIFNDVNPLEPCMSIDAEDTEFTVVINDEEQYSIWPTYKPVPEGWREVGIAGLKPYCLDYIERTWTDMRPRSLREAMERGHADVVQRVTES
jgi:MbtH protein